MELGKIKTNAFTLIELLVVIAIIGILSGLIIVGMSSSVNSANVAKAQIFSASLRDSLLINIVAELKFDGFGIADNNPVVFGTSTYLNDSWGGINNCNMVGTAPNFFSGTNCLYGSCLEFDGSGDYIECGNNTVLNITNAITVEAWIKPALIGQGDFINKGVSYNPPNNTGYFMSVNSSGTINYQLGVANDWLNDGGTKLLNQNKWNHVAMTFNGSLVSGYVNGAVDRTWTRTGVIGTNANNLRIGARPEFTHYFNGYIDNLRIYNSSVPSSKIKEQYFVGLSYLLANRELNRGEYSNKIIYYE